ncbi:MAG: transglycosylase SLT domain-containing protein [Bacteroidales bacterium]|nr:transglycosylase SLT domain-containing protein [Bacteroidales bacterium]
MRKLLVAILTMMVSAMGLSAAPVDTLRLNFKSFDQIDSSVTIWYLQKHKAELASDTPSSSFVGETGDEVYIKRLQEIHSYIPLIYNDSVRSYIRSYSEKSSTWISQMMSLCYYYMPIIESELARNGLPMELKVLPIVISQLDPRCESFSEGNKGLWQFSLSEAKSFGLKIDSFVDERMDPYKSTEAAVKALKQYYDSLGDWNLAIAALASSLNTVRAAMAKSGGSTSFESISSSLPKNAQTIVPKFVAMLYTVHYRKELGIIPIACTLPGSVSEHVAERNIDLRQVAKLSGVQVDELTNVNPQYLHYIIPSGFVFRVPGEYSSAVYSLADALYTPSEVQKPIVDNSSKDKPAVSTNAVQSSPAKRSTYKVKSGDTLGGIAAKHHMSVAKLKKLNNLTKDLIRPGQILYTN